MTKLIKPSVLLKQTWALYREKFVLLFSLMFFPCLLLELDPLLNNLDPAFSLNASILIIIASALLTTWAGIAVVLVLDNKKLTYREACRESWSKFWSLIWVAIISCFVVGGGFALFVLPGLIFAVYFMFAKLIAVLENKKGVTALARSREYVRGYFWAVTGRYALVVFVSLLVYSVLSAVVGLLIGGIVVSATAGFLITSFLTVVINTITFPLMVTAVYLVYHNLRSVRGEVVVLNAGKKFWPYLAVSATGWVWLFIFIFFLFTMFMTFLISFLTSSFVTEAIMSAPSTLPN